MKVFDAYSQYYDLLYRDKDYAAETDYVNALIKLYSTNSDSILELGCGTGIHACLLSEAGYRVTGVDRSKTMLDKALERVKDKNLSSKISFTEGDIRTVSISRKFDVIISLFHVMSYLETNEDLDKVFKTVKKHLNSGGLFIFDCWYGPAVLADRPAIRTKIIENEEIYINRTATPGMDEKKNTVDVNFDIFIENKNTGEKYDLQETHKMRYLFTEELKSLAEQNGLEIICGQEWLTKNNLSEKTWNACYTCKNN